LARPAENNGASLAAQGRPSKRWPAGKSPQKASCFGRDTLVRVDSWRFDVDDPVQVYLRTVTTVRPLTKDEEIELSRHVLANDEQAESAGKTLLEANLAMVISIAERYPTGNMHLLDLVQKGNTGLLLALKTFPDHPNQSFSAYAAACVDAAIAKAIAESRPVEE
jgi:DNA-directed RNA polymerase sigma subunit (sigma70/sigma32)